MMSVMFAGMTLSAIFGGIARSMLSFIGVSGPLSTMLKAALLPAFMKLAPILLKLGEWVMGLSENTRLLMGVFIIVMAVLAPIIVLIGTLGVAFAAVSAPLSVFIAGILGAVGVIILVSAFIAALVSEDFPWLNDAVDATVKLMINAWRFLIQGLTNIVDGVLGLLASLGEFMYNVLTGQWGKAVKELKAIIYNLYKIVKGIFQSLFNGVLSIMKSAFPKMYDKAKTLGQKIIDGIVDVIKNSPNAIADALGSVMPGGLGTAIKAGGSMLGKVGNIFNVNDFVMTPNGDVLKYSPSDYIFGTKNPENIAGGGGTNVNVTVNNPELRNNIDIDRLTDRVSDNLSRDIGGRSNLG
jgi:hypothetical protein